MNDALETARRTGAGGDTPVVAARRRRIDPSLFRPALALCAAPAPVASTTRAPKAVAGLSLISVLPVLIKGLQQPPKLLNPWHAMEAVRDDVHIVLQLTPPFVGPFDYGSEPEHLALQLRHAPIHLFQLPIQLAQIAELRRLAIKA